MAVIPKHNVGAKRVADVPTLTVGTGTDGTSPTINAGIGALLHYIPADRLCFASIQNQD